MELKELLNLTREELDRAEVPYTEEESEFKVYIKDKGETLAEYSIHGAEKAPEGNVFIMVETVSGYLINLDFNEEGLKEQKLSELLKAIKVKLTQKEDETVKEEPQRELTMMSIRLSDGTLSVYKDECYNLEELSAKVYRAFLDKRESVIQFEVYGDEDTLEEIAIDLSKVLAISRYYESVKEED